MGEYRDSEKHRAPSMKKIVFIIGSLRKESFNRRLSRLAEEALLGRAEIVCVSPADVPLLNQDIEFPPPAGVLAVRRRILEADGVWIFSPEYNHSIPGGVKNLLDWLSRPMAPPPASGESCVQGKKVTVSGVGGRNKTAGMRLEMNDLLSFIGMDVFGAPGYGAALPAEAFATGRWVPDGETVEAIRDQAAAFWAVL